MTKVTGKNINLAFILNNKSTIEILNKDTAQKEQIKINELISNRIINNLITKIKAGKSTSAIPEFQVIQDVLGLTIIKGGTSSQKADIVLDINNNLVSKENEGFGIKSYLGSKPTLLNASGNTNFIFEVENLDKSRVDEINSINTRTKLKDRIRAIENYGGVFKYVASEKKTMEYNLKMVDSLMPEIIGTILLAFYRDRISAIADIVDHIHEHTSLIKKVNYEDKNLLVSKVKKLLVDILLGFFAGSTWDGSYEANGTIIIKKSGEQVAFHIIDLESLKSYLYNNIKLDTPSTTRHRYGKVIIEGNNKLYFKLNLQLRF